ncbi:MAG: orotate phosphoribosyltransferase [Verrucomicrobiota bacterium]
MKPEEVIALFKETNALLDGHFLLRSGLHSRQFFQCAILLQHTTVAARVCAALAEKLRSVPCDSVISPALGGLIVGHEVARTLGKRHIFAEKEDGRLVLRRGFTMRPGERFLVLEDVVTRGGRVQETIDIVRERGGVVAAVGTLVDRSGDQTPDFGCPFVSLIKLNTETYEPDNLPPDLAGTEAIKPGSK